MNYSGVGAKIVSLTPAYQAAASVGAIDIFDDLDVGNLGECAGRATGEPCRAFTGGGILDWCVCINLSENQTLLELKQLVSDVTGQTMSGGFAWTTADEDVLLAWADDESGLHSPSMRHPWIGGWIGVSELLQRTESSWAYPTGRGILALLERTGCLAVNGGVGGCDKYPRLMSAVSELGTAGGQGAGFERVVLYPPRFGAVAREPGPIEPGGDVPDATRIELELQGATPLSGAVWGLVGVGVVVGAYALVTRPWRRRRLRAA